MLLLIIHVIHMSYYESYYIIVVFGNINLFFIWVIWDTLAIIIVTISICIQYILLSTKYIYYI